MKASVWITDTARAETIGARRETGTDFTTCAGYPDPVLFRTGCKDTGRDSGLSVLGYHHLTRTKSYHLRKLP